VSARITMTAGYDKSRTGGVVIAPHLGDGTSLIVALVRAEDGADDALTGIWSSNAAMASSRLRRRSPQGRGWRALAQRAISEEIRGHSSQPRHAGDYPYRPG
jgi:hypothetical protein